MGVVDKAKIIDNKTMRPGDVILALPSSGVHSNGFSLVRKVFRVGEADITAPVAELGGKSVGETLLTPTKIYVKPMLALFEKVRSRASATSPAAASTRTSPAPSRTGSARRSRRPR